jgi:Pyruvate/2-oxoacid:ferredoxin oxidoreductase delta subunit
LSEPGQQSTTSFRKLAIYFFSGTGNSRNAAVWLERCAEEKGIKVNLINISLSQRRLVPPPPDDALVAFISPVHGFNYPPIMVNFIAHFPRGKNRVVLMNTRAGMLIGKWITPGLTGIAFYLATLILMLKGYSIQGMLPVDLPSNWLFVHPGLNERTVKYLHERNKERVRAFAQRILSGNRDFRCFREIIQDLFVAPVSVLYYCFGRFFLSKTYFASSDCSNCGRCINDCPVRAIIQINGRPFWTYHCESCMRCVGNCPEKAIETAQGFAFGIWSLCFFVISALFFEGPALLFFPIGNPLAHFIVETVVALCAIFLGYRAMHYLLRYKWFEKLMVLTSLTNYRFWGRRYRAPKP